jgi:hypothetical protein
MPSSIKLIGGSFDATDTTMLSSLSSHRGGGDGEEFPAVADWCC